MVWQPRQAIPVSAEQSLTQTARKRRRLVCALRSLTGDRRVKAFGFSWHHADEQKTFYLGG